MDRARRPSSGLMDNFLRLVSALVRYRAFYDITSNLARTIDSRTPARKYLLQLPTSVKLDDKSDDDDERHDPNVLSSNEIAPWRFLSIHEGSAAVCSSLFTRISGVDYIWMIVLIDKRIEDRSYNFLSCNLFSLAVRRIGLFNLIENRRSL